MKTVFADTSFFVAFLSSTDELHEPAVRHMQGHHGLVVTSAWVLAELGNFLSGTSDRDLFPPFVRQLRSNKHFQMLSPDLEQFDAGLSLYERRMDKAWSMTDCISFAIMDQLSIREALTADHHFEQAGFVALLK